VFVRDRPSLIGLTVAGVLMSRLLLTDEPPMAYCPTLRSADETDERQPLAWPLLPDSA
jgi:hypothetical protein